MPYGNLPSQTIWDDDKDEFRVICFGDITILNNYFKEEHKEKRQEFLKKKKYETSFVGIIQACMSRIRNYWRDPSFRFRMIRIHLDILYYDVRARVVSLFFPKRDL